MCDKPSEVSDSCLNIGTFNMGPNANPGMSGDNAVLISVATGMLRSIDNHDASLPLKKKSSSRMNQVVLTVLTH